MIYVMQAGIRGAVKIGYVRGGVAAVQQRKAALQTGCPQDLTVLATAPGSEEIEALLHGRFGVGRVRGEWFTLDEQTIANMDDVYLATTIYDCMLESMGYERPDGWPEPLPEADAA